MDGHHHRNEESWHDGCRECYCHNGREMCALITCPVPACANPTIRPGQCCPSCTGKSWLPACRAPPPPALWGPVPTCDSAERVGSVLGTPSQLSVASVINSHRVNWILWIISPKPKKILKLWKWFSIFWNGLLSYIALWTSFFFSCRGL